jgi:Secretion system C-terminal sorting domain
MQIVLTNQSMRMKRNLLIVIMIIGATALQAQLPYPPAPLPAGNMVQFEYFFNTDPGAGNGTPIPVPVPQPDLNNFALSIPTTALPQGFYRAYLRSRDANGQWSHTGYAFFSNVVAPVYPSAPPAPVNIVKLEYAIDASPPFGGGTDIPIVPGLDVANQNVNINVSALPSGPHILYIRSRDANGLWSITNVTFFDNSVASPYPVAPLPAKALQQLEYFIDTDPGFGLATPVSFSAGTDITTSFSVNGLANGTHNFYIRSRNNPWSLTTVVPFVVGSVTPVNWLYIRGEIKNNTSWIEWATASEQNSRQFELEHSADGRRFVPIATVAAAGNSNTTRQYNAQHPSPLPGIHYYRIKQVDNDGSYRYSAVLTLLFKNEKGITVSPNPVNDYTTVWLDAPNPVTLRLCSANGQFLKQQKINGQWQYRLDMAGLPAGKYILELRDEKQAKQQISIQKL